MSQAARERATLAQLAASDPTVSAFVAASAGSGKTKLLTDRLLRLMLAGTSPDRIQCLTFTKAAAAEMALRLQRTLGRWVTLADDLLAQELRRLHVEPTEAACRQARALFAHVLDLPGGMRIGTIHAFSQSLLRRFPLEAAISPHFQLVDDRDAADALSEAREAMLASADTPAMQQALQTMAGLASAAQFGRHVTALQTDRDRLRRAVSLGADLAAAQRRALGIKGTTEAEIIAEGVQWMAEHVLRKAAEVVASHGSPGCADRAKGILAWLGLTPDIRTTRWDGWRDSFFNAGGEIRGDTAFVNQKLGKAQPALLQAFLEEAARIQRIDDACRALRVVAVSEALMTLAAPVVSGYASRKDDAGLLDYGDLISRTSSLLVDPGAAWVLYKLDGGLDHLLLDEVQDTAPEQWQIAHALTAEFFAGRGARDGIRSVFAVGDRKQSIYSFQGADTEEFDRSRKLLSRRVTEAGHSFQDAGLDVSFRSTSPVLELVDRVFADPVAGRGVRGDGETLAHYADRSDHAGVVELWPLAPCPTVPPPMPWTVPDENQGLTSAPQLLADTLADWIRVQTSGEVMLESRGRPVAPGDVMVLVRQRDSFARSLVKALKSRGVPVAGLDRLTLSEQPAVQDLMALGDALLLPQDDLSFACVLTSPLGGLNDDDLMALAINRTCTLWAALRDRAGENVRWQRAWDFFAPLLSRVDYAAPFALFAEALGPLGGRARLLARLGPEAAEPIDEFLNAALTFARTHPPALQGFLHWLRRSGAEVKREAAAVGDLVRVMTVHGAKGLQAPLVVLPDTTRLPPDEGGVLWATDPATKTPVPVWSPRRELRCQAVDGMRAALRQRRLEEYNRLLYVALTRAEDRLLICGWQGRRDADPECWYHLVARGFSSIACERAPFDRWDGEVLRFRSAQVASPQPDRTRTIVDDPVTLPAWLGCAPDWRAVPPPPEPPRPKPLAPSRPEGVELGSMPAASSPLGGRDSTGRRFRRGQLIHALLQHLPDVPPVDRRPAAMRFANRPGHGLTDDEVANLVSETIGIIEHPELMALFGPGGRSEVPISGTIGNLVLGGVVDRMVVLPNRVLIADFKSNRRTPAQVADTPVMYLRQMAGYRAVLRSVFPGYDVRCILVWTREPRVVMLPDELLDPQAPGFARSA